MDIRKLMEGVDRFHARVTRGGPDECWQWTGASLRKDGRGTMSVGGKNYTAPRLALIYAGRLPDADDAFACHTCDNPGCVNPAHLWWGDNRANIRDASAKRRLHTQNVTHCPHGHEYTEANTRRRRNRDGSFARICRECHRAHMRKYNSRRPSRARAALSNQIHQGDGEANNLPIEG